MGKTSVISTPPGFTSSRIFLPQALRMLGRMATKKLLLCEFGNDVVEDVDVRVIEDQVELFLFGDPRFKEVPNFKGYIARKSIRAA